MAKQKNNSVEPERLLESFKQKDFAPLYLFHGEEDFLIEEFVDLLVELAVDPSSRNFNLDVLHAKETDVKEVISHASSFPLMAERRVVIVRDADSFAATDANREILLRYVEHPLSSTILVFTMQKADMRLTLFKAFQEKGIVVECKPLYENQVPDWITMRVEKYGRMITPEGCRLVQAYVGSSMREIHNEIEKLLIYIGEKKLIEGDDVHAVVGMSKHYNVFELQKAIGQRDLPLAINILEHMMDMGDSPLGMIAMLTRYFHKLWIVPAAGEHSKSENELASALGVSPFHVKEYLSASRRFSPAHIEQAFPLLLEADVILKSTMQDSKLVMTALVCKLIKPFEEPIVY